MFRTVILAAALLASAPAWADDEPVIPYASEKLVCKSKIGTFRAHVEWGGENSWIDIPGWGRVPLEDAGSVGTGMPGHVWSGGGTSTYKSGVMTDPEPGARVMFVADGEPDRIYLDGVEHDAKCRKE